jgi:hypothetical protein
MTYVRASGGIDLIIRLAALREKSIDLSILMAALESDGILGRNSTLIMFGPIFGEDVLNTLIGRLQALGLSYVDDFIELNVDIPDWLEIAVDYKQGDTPVGS